MVRIRMSRIGRPHRPFYRINAIDSRTKRDGKVIENLGWYDPVAGEGAKQLELKVDRIKHWLSVGAQPSETLTDVLVKNNIMDGTARKAEIAERIEAKKKAAAKVAANPPGEKKADAKA